MISTTISHYKIIEKIGEGGMGTVYLANDLKLDRQVAIKFLPEYLTTDKDNIERFEREAKAAAALNHPNIVTIYDVIEADSSICIVMEYVDGGSLRVKIDSASSDLDEILDITKQICDGLAEAHKADIVHRDIKPENILIDSRGRVKILDFGLAKLKGVSKLTKESATVGTIHYMSPEQIKGQDVDQRSDIWALGVVMYELLSGEIPFKGEYESSVNYAILNAEPESLNPTISPHLKRIINTCLQKDPVDRYKDIHVLMLDLNRFKSESTGTALTTEKRKGRSKFILIPIGVLAIVILVSYFFFLPGVENGSRSDNSIAVLPFTNLSANHENEFFCDGITEDIIAQLSKIGNLKVISRTSIMQYKNVKKSLPQIAEELNVTMILEGTVRQSTDRIRIVAQLIEAREDKHLWAETYDRKFSDIFAIQSDVAEKIATVLRVEISPQEKSQIQKKPTENFTAYNYYLKGRQYYSQYQKDDNDQAIRLFKKALEIDPNYALAYAGLGDAYSQGYSRFGYSVAWIDSAFLFSKKAIEIDPASSEAYKALGTAYSVIDRTSLAIDAYKKAVELNPGNYMAVGNLGYRYLEIGRLQEALKWNLKKIELNPPFGGGYMQLGLVYNSLCEDEKAKNAHEKAIELDPQVVKSYWGLISLLLAQNKYDTAFAEISEILISTTDSLNACTYAGYIKHVQNNLSEADYYFDQALQKSQAKIHYDHHIIPIVHIGAIQWKRGEKKRAEKIFLEFMEYANKEIDTGNESWEIRYNFAGVYSILGEQKEALIWLDRAIEAGWTEYRIGKIEPLFENLRQDKEFEQRINRVKELIEKERQQINAARK